MKEIKRILSFTRRAVDDYDMIEDGDRIAVCISGGKDSMLMAKLFQELKRYSGFPLRWNMWSWIPATAKQTAV